MEIGKYCVGLAIGRQKKWYVHTGAYTIYENDKENMKYYIVTLTACERFEHAKVDASSKDTNIQMLKVFASSFK